jgi:plasmid stability protein
MYAMIALRSDGGEATDVATLMIRGLDEDLKARLRIQAAEHGRSMEAEARALLAAALTARRPSRGLGSYIRDQFAEIGGVDLAIPSRTETARAVKLDS